MIKEVFSTIIFEPLYNTLVLLIDLVPGADVGIAVILLTIIVKLILFPISKTFVRTQIKMKVLQKPLEELKIKHKDNRTALAEATLGLYKKHKLNPISGIILIFLQFPVLIGLYFVFLRGGFPEINPDILYSFIKNPEVVNINFLGLIDISKPHNWSLALTAAVTQFFQAKYSFPKQDPPKEGEKRSFQTDFMKGMGVQVTYVLPLVILGISWTLPAAVSLYFTISNLFAIGQEVYIRNKIKKPEEERLRLEDEKNKLEEK